MTALNNRAKDATITIGKPAAETLSERLAFHDPDRSTPVHDDITLWLDGWVRSETGCRAVAGMSGARRWSAEVVEGEIKKVQDIALEQQGTVRRLAARERIEPWEKRQIEDASRWLGWVPPDIPPVPAPKPGTVTWEMAVGTERWVSGFIDMVAEISTPGIELPALPYAAWQITWTRQRYAFEVKSVIPSLGELIRQIRYYESKYPARYYVVAPDMTHAETLRSQRIGFVHYPTGEVTRDR